MSKRKQSKDQAPSPYPIRSRANNSITVTDLAEDLMASSGEETEGIEEGSVSYRLMKQLITKVENNLTTKFNKAVGEIKDEVSEIKNHLGRYCESFTEVQERLSSVEDKVGTIDTVKTEFNTFKQAWEEQLTQVNLDACRARKNNVIIHGIKGGSKEPGVAMQSFRKVCEEGLKLSKEWVDAADLNECYHFSPKGGEGQWPLFVSFAKSHQREELFRASPNLKGTNYILRNDLAPWLQKIRKDLIVESGKLRKDPHNCDTKMRDTAFKVWMIYKLPNTTKWLTWKGWDDFNSGTSNPS